MQSMCMVDFVMRYLVEGTPKLGSDGGPPLGMETLLTPYNKFAPPYVIFGHSASKDVLISQNLERLAIVYSASLHLMYTASDS